MGVRQGKKARELKAKRREEVKEKKGE